MCFSARGSLPDTRRSAAQVQGPSRARKNTSVASTSLTLIEHRHNACTAARLERKGSWRQPTCRWG